MPKDRNPFWDHTVEADGRLKCKYCEQTFALKVSVSRIKAHLSGVSALRVEVCRNAPAEAQQEAYEAIRSKRQKLVLPHLIHEQPQAPENLSVQEHRYGVPEIPAENNDAVLNTSWENTAGQMQPAFTRMPSSSNNEARSTFPVEGVDAGQEEDWGQYFIADPYLQSLTLEDHVPLARVMPSSSNGEVKTSDPTTAPTQTTQENQVDQELACDDNIGISSSDMTTKYPLVIIREPLGEGFERNKKEIWSLLLNDQVSMIGVYGMGGVGKTTLITHIHDELQVRSFPPVYWITVTQDFSMHRLQDKIAEAIHFDILYKDDERKRAAMLKVELMKKQKYLLILDDLWDDFEPEEVGIPVGANGGKLLITTRDLGVCRRMKCQEEHIIKMNPLSEKEGWELFKKELGKYNEEVEAIAKAVARQCAGLPLGIRTMAACMRGVGDLFEWRDALRDLEQSRVGNGDPKQKVFEILRLSYERLNDKSLKECFLFCALFPEHFEFDREDLIKLWIATRMVEGEVGCHDKARVMLSKLENACLLDGFTDTSGNTFFKMHDLIRDMALQKLRENSVIVESGRGLVELPDMEHWREDLQTVSLMSNNLKEIPSSHSPYCPNLLVLLLRFNHNLDSIADSFFEHFSILKVLDLSSTRIKKLSCSISNLVTLNALLLNGCIELKDIPSLRMLKALKTLDLQSCGIEKLPEGIEVLHKLTYLDLSDCEQLQQFLVGILPNLAHLQLLRVYHKFPLKAEVVKGLSKLEVLECRFNNLIEFYKFLRSWNQDLLCRYGIMVGPAPIHGSKFERQKSVGLCECDMSKDKTYYALPEGTEELHLYDCNGGRTLADLLALNDANQLKLIYMKDCDGIECLVSWSRLSHDNIFDKLECIDLVSLNNLSMLVGSENNVLLPPMPSNRSIFAHLKKLQISCCDNVRELFQPSLVPNLQNLEEIIAWNCLRIEEIIESEERNENQIILPKLKRLQLWDLPQLKSIYNGLLICDSLEYVSIDRCFKLKRIPIHLPLPSLTKLRVYPKQWWEQMEWGHPIAKSSLLPHCDFTTSLSEV